MTTIAQSDKGVRLTWTTCAFTVLVVMLVGIVLALQIPFWLAPPLLFYTHIFYEFLALAWLPIFIVFALIRPTGDPRIAKVVLVLGIVVLLYCIAAIVFNLNTEFGPGARALQRCEADNSNSQFIRYSCTFAGYSEGASAVIFEGYKDSPFVWKVYPSS
jgi:hypothetical protein